jgi:glycosyltransferase involved in cell wall biosynthesis
VSAAGQVALGLVTRDQADYLRVFLGNYLRHGAGKAPLIVIDDGSRDATAEILAALPKDSGIAVHRIAHVTIAHARNEALRRSPAPWLAFSDTDCLLDGDYFEALESIPARFAGSAAVEGAVLAPAGPPPPFTHGVANLAGGFFATANMVFHVPSILALGGFDETRFGDYREDTDLALTVLEKKGAVPFYPDLAVIHPFIPRRFLKSLRGAWSSQSRIVAAEIALFQKHPRSYTLVRRHRDARRTLRAWCGRHSLSSLRSSFNYLRATRSGAGLFASLQAAIVATVEHVFILLLCLAHAGKISRLKSDS